MIRIATKEDLGAVVRIYDRIHTAEESGRSRIGWDRGIYPIRKTAEEAIKEEE